MKLRTLAVSMAVAGAFAWGSAQGAIINGSFETGDLTGWDVGGGAAAATVIGTGGGGPTHGEFQALLDTVDGGGQDTTISQSISFFASAGNKITFDWNFLTNEGTPGVNDRSEVILDGDVTFLADTFSVFVVGDLGYAEQTGYQSGLLVVGTTGLHTLTFRVTDVGDSIVTSGLLVDNVVLVPEPGSLALLGLGLLGLAGLRRRS